MRYSIKLLLALLLTNLWACQDDYVFENPDYVSKIVVYGLLSNEGAIQVSVSNSVASLSNNDPTYLENAIVEVWENGVSLGLGVYDAFDKKFNWPNIPQPGAVYRVRVQHPGYPVIDEQLTLPGGAGVISIQYLDSVGLDSTGNALAAIIASINDPGGETNYYRLQFSYFDDLLNRFMVMAVSTNEGVLLSPSTQRLDDGSYLFSDELFNGTQQQIRVEFTRDVALASPKFLSLLESLSSDYYLYELSAARFEENRNEPLSEPVFIHSNIRNGLGLWAGKVVERDTVY